MATNQRRNIRTIFQATANIAGLTNAQVLQLIQSETTAGAQADVGGLQVGDFVSIAPGDVAAGLIDNPHDNLGNTVSRLFLVVPIVGKSPSTPDARHALREVSVARLFW